jgi:hypothetical protein
MSVHISAIVWKRQFPSHSAKLVALKLADVAGDDGAHVYPAVKTVAEECQLSEKSVRRAISEMRKAGVLVLIARGSNQGATEEGSAPRGTRKNHEYAFDIDALLGLPLSAPIIKKDLKDEEKTVDTVSNVSGERGTQSPPTVDTVSNAHIIGNSEPSKEPTRAERVFLSFEDFENKWPWYSHEKRTVAARQWSKLSEEERQGAFDGIGKYIKSKHPGGKRTSAGNYLAEKVWLSRSAPTVSRSVFVVEGSEAWRYAVRRRNIENGFAENASFSVTIKSNHPESGNRVMGFEWRIGWFTGGDLPAAVEAEKDLKWWIIERPVDG